MDGFSSLAKSILDDDQGISELSYNKLCELSKELGKYGYYSEFEYEIKPKVNATEGRYYLTSKFN